MRTYHARITPLSAFGTRPLGDTLFGQLCWAVRNRHGEERLSSLLDRYTHGRPFAVISDVFPADYLPRPALPGHWFAEVQDPDRKAVKKRAWLPLEAFATPVAEWLAHCKAGSEILGGAAIAHPQPHNTLSRTTGTTGEGQFAPYAMDQLWYGEKGRRVEVALDLYVVLDEARLTVAEFRELLEDIGALGFGRDASIGLGKFRLDDLAAFELPAQPDADAWLTLAPCAPQGLSWQVERSFYTTFTRFGRHGDLAVRQGNPFKTPVLLASAGAVLTPVTFQPRAFIGQGLGGDGSLSKPIPATVHQGYAPVAAIALPKNRRREAV